MIEIDQGVLTNHNAPSHKTGFSKNPIWTWWEENWIVRKTNSKWIAIKKINLQGNNIIDRSTSLLQQYWRENTKQWFDLSEKYWYKPEFVICLAQAETWLWWEKKSYHNYFNCWNNDRWDTVSFSNLEHSFRWLHYSCLDGKYLKNKQTLSHLNPPHKDSTCQQERTDECNYVYASSEENWMNNMTNCISNIHQKQIWSDYNFRTEKQ